MSWVPSPYLMAHQREGAEIALTNPRFAFFDDTGTGKTLLGIELIKQKKFKTLVVCKLSLIVNAWMSDLSRFAPELKVANLWEIQRKRNGKTPPHDVAIINYERFRTTWTKLAGYEMVLIDESSSIKDHRSQITKALIRYTDKIPNVYLFSGTPAPNNPLEYWSQMRVISPDLLGRSYYSFRNKYCYSTGYGGYTWVMKGDLKPEFLEKIGTKSRVVRKEDCLTLPDRVFVDRVVDLDDKEMEAYRVMESEMILEIKGKESIAANAAVKLLKLRQGTSGFFYDTEGVPIITGHSKLTALKELLEEIGDHQVIIWTHFHEEADQVTEMLQTDFVRVDGTKTNQKDKDRDVQAFIKGEVKYLVSHPASLGHGVTLTNCSYAIYYSLSHSFELAYQSQDRIYRKGQRNFCTYYRLIARNTIDIAIKKALEKKEDVVNSVFRYLKNSS